MSNAVEIQRAYYAKTASHYDAMHVPGDQRDEHFLALAVMAGLMIYYDCQSVLDVGAGTGRTLVWLKQRGLGKAVGVEPVAELRARGYEKSLSPSELIDGDATHLPFADCEFDLVCCFGVLHHVPRPDLAVQEILRVARRMVFISDSNNFGQGGRVMRAVKQTANALGLWPVLNYLKTRGREYTISEEDGLAYSYSVFTSYPVIRTACSIVHLFNTTDSASVNPYRGAPHVALAGIKAF
jgi:ubiquinone/menaquinone biosynthesis C-methylase UbiE